MALETYSPLKDISVVVTLEVVGNGIAHYQLLFRLPGRDHLLCIIAVMRDASAGRVLSEMIELRSNAPSRILSTYDHPFTPLGDTHQRREDYRAAHAALEKFLLTYERNQATHRASI